MYAVCLVDTRTGGCFFYNRLMNPASILSAPPPQWRHSAQPVHALRTLRAKGWQILLVLCAACTGLYNTAAWAAAPQPTRLQDPAALASQVDAFLQDQAASYPGTPSIQVDPPRISNQAACDQIDLSLSGSGNLQSRTSVRARCLAPQSWTIYVQASVQIMGHYFVASHTINRGAVLGDDDLTTREGDLLRLRRTISDASQIKGWIATRRIRAGGPIEYSALRDPNSIARGQQVRTIARGKGFVASGEGEALESGGPGARIQVRTPGGQIITGTVLDAHTVQVMM